MRARLLRFHAVVLMGLAYASAAFAQHGDPLDVQSCYSNILVDKSIDWSNEKLRYAMLSLWNKDYYNLAKASNSLSVFYAGAKADDTYEQSNEQRLRELYEKKESLDYDRETASWRFFLDPQAGKILKDCLDAKVRLGYGFSTVYYLDDYKTATLELIWNWAPENAPLRIHTSNIRNAVVTDDDGSHPKHLLAVTDHGWEVFRGHDKLITLQRLKPDEDIIVNIETNPDVRATHVTIPAVAKKQDCKPSTESKDAFGQAYERTSLRSPDMNVLPRDSDDGNGHKYVHWTVDVAASFPDIGQNGIVSGGSCAKADLSEFYDVYPALQAAGSTATCRGMFQNAGKFMVMSVSWYKKGYSCTDIEWPADETRPAALSPAKPKAKQAAPSH